MKRTEIDRIQNAIRHIKTSVDIDSWAMEIAVEAMEKQIPQELGSKVMDYLGRARPECGNCGEVIEDAMWDYCPWCGQRIGGEG
jgi:hypothetical protein